MKKQYAILTKEETLGFNFALYMDDDQVMTFECPIKAHRFAEELNK